MINEILSSNSGINKKQYDWYVSNVQDYKKRIFRRSLILSHWEKLGVISLSKWLQLQLAMLIHFHSKEAERLGESLDFSKIFIENMNGH